MTETLKKAAAKHSMKAYALVTAARQVRRAAADLDVAGAKAMAARARALARAIDDRRRKTMKSRAEIMGNDPDHHWWNFGSYTGDDCPNCKRQRLMLSQDNAGKQRVICEKCHWEPAANDYCHEAGNS